jgi:cytochrome P450 monooxygenase
MIHEFNIVLDSWAETVPTSSFSQQVEETKFVADSVAICRQLPFRMIAMCLYGTMLTEEVRARKPSNFSSFLCR